MHEGRLLRLQKVLRQNLEIMSNEWIKPRATTVILGLNLFIIERLGGQYFYYSVVQKKEFFLMLD